MKFIRNLFRTYECKALMKHLEDLRDLPIGTERMMGAIDYPRTCARAAHNGGSPSTPSGDSTAKG